MAFHTKRDCLGLGVSMPAIPSICYILLFVRALLATFLHGFPSLHFRENLKKIKKSTPQQLPFLFPFPGKLTVLPNALGRTVHFPLYCLIIKNTLPLSLSVHAFFLSLSATRLTFSLSLPFRHSQQLPPSLPRSPSHRIISACRHGDRCSHLHNRPMISPMILLSNMYQRPDTPPTGLNPSKSNNPSTPTSSMSEPTTSPPINHQRQTKTQSKHNTLSHRKPPPKYTKKKKKNPQSVQTRHCAFTFRRPPVAHDERGESDGDERKS
jgi:hypothetical protein